MMSRTCVSLPPMSAVLQASSAYSFLSFLREALMSRQRTRAGKGRSFSSRVNTAYMALNMR